MSCHGLPQRWRQSCIPKVQAPACTHCLIWQKHRNAELCSCRHEVAQDANKSCQAPGQVIIDIVYNYYFDMLKYKQDLIIRIFIIKRCRGAADLESKRNPGEAAVALEHCRRLLAAGLKPASIGLITPYSAQATPVSNCC